MTHDSSRLQNLEKARGWVGVEGNVMEFTEIKIHINIRRRRIFMVTDPRNSEECQKGHVLDQVKKIV